MMMSIGFLTASSGGNARTGSDRAPVLFLSHRLGTSVCLAVFVLVFGYSPAGAFSFTFGGGGRDHPYPNEPQYQYPGKELRKCPKGFAPWQGKCRKIRWVR
jgi:hypothetical protein